jgi:peptide-methionine (S)-S-oxide reductase
MAAPATHAVSGARLEPPFPAGTELALFGMGCFWGAERCFWQRAGVCSTSVGYAGGFTPNPTYQEVCSGLTGHAEVVRVVFDPAVASYDALLRVFWESHDPTQGMRQANAPEFYYAEDYHQQYLAKNPGGYCGLGGTGVRCPAPSPHTP